MAKSKPFDVIWFTDKDLGRVDLNVDLNYRNPLLMNVSGMVDDLVRDGGVIQQPLHFWKPTDEVKALHNICNDLVRMRGHRRLAAMQFILANPDTFSATVVENIKRFPAVVWDGLSYQEARLFILDQNSEQGLAPSEIVKAVYDLSAMGYGEMDIADRLYNLLGKLTKAGRDKIRKAESLADEKQRRKLIRDAVHPYLGNYLLRAEKIGPWVRDQVIMLHRAADNALSPEEVVLMTANTAAMNELSAAKTRDEKNVPTMWEGPVVDVTIDDKDGIHVSGGGEETRKVIVDLITTRKGGKPEGGEVQHVLSARNLKDKMDSFRSRFFKGGLRLASGEKSEEYARLDDEAYLIERKLEWLATLDGQFIMPEIGDAMKALRDEKDLNMVKEAFAPLMKTT